jgi:hypothetical protein
VSEWAGGFTEQLAEKIVYGEEKFLEGRGCATASSPMDVAAGEPHLEEEAFMDADDAVQDESSNELPESVREDLCQRTPKETNKNDSEGTL